MAEPNKNRSLYDIPADLTALEDLLVECGGDVSDELAAAAIERWMADLSTDLSTKADNYAALIRTLEARAATRKAEAERMRDRARVDENAAKGLKTRLMEAMRAINVAKVEGDRFTVAVQRNGGRPALVFSDDADIESAPEWAFETVTSRRWATDAIRSRITEGEDIGFASIAIPGFGLRIR